MIGAKHVDHYIEAPFKLLDMIGDVWQAVGRLTGRLHEHRVILFPEGRRLKPCRAVSFVEHVLIAERLQRRLNLAVVVQRALVEVATHAHVEAL